MPPPSPLSPKSITPLSLPLSPQSMVSPVLPLSPQSMVSPVAPLSPQSKTSSPLVGSSDDCSPCAVVRPPQSIWQTSKLLVFHLGPDYPILRGASASLAISLWSIKSIMKVQTVISFSMCFQKVTRHFVPKTPSTLS